MAFKGIIMESTFNVPIMVLVVIEPSYLAPFHNSSAKLSSQALMAQVVDEKANVINPNAFVVASANLIKVLITTSFVEDYFIPVSYFLVQFRPDSIMATCSFIRMIAISSFADLVLDQAIGRMNVAYTTRHVVLFVIVMIRLGGFIMDLMPSRVDPTYSVKALVLDRLIMLLIRQQV